MIAPFHIQGGGVASRGAPRLLRPGPTPSRECRLRGSRVPSLAATSSPSSSIASRAVVASGVSHRRRACIASARRRAPHAVSSSSSSFPSSPPFVVSGAGAGSSAWAGVHTAQEAEEKEVGDDPAHASAAHSIDTAISSHGADEDEGERERQELRATLSLRSAVLLVARRRWPKVVLAACAMLGATSVLLAAPIFSSGVIECLIGARPDADFPRLLCGLVAVYAAEPLFTFAYVRSVCSLGEETVASLRRDLFRALLSQRVSFFDAHRAGELAALLSVEVGAVRQLVTANVSRDRGFRALAECVGTLAVLFCIVPKLAPILGGAIVAFSATTAGFNRSMGKLFAADAQAQGAVSATAGATLGAIRTVRSFGGEALSFSRFGAEAAAAEMSGIHLSKAKAMLECINRGCIYTSLLLLYAAINTLIFPFRCPSWRRYARGGWLVKSGQITVGSLIACIGYAFGLIFATQGVVNTVADARAAVAALGRARDLVTSAAPDPALAYVIPAESESTIASEESESTSASRERQAAAAAEGAAAARALAASGDIELRDVHFAFPSRPQVDVLTGVNMTLAQGRVTALVGSSGAGKSTITQLLCRFYDPDSGIITVGGEDLSRLSRVSWLDAVALVGQEPVLFAGSVADNIRYGRASATAGLASRPPPTVRRCK